MAFITCNFFSEVLGISTAINVILPQNTVNQIGMKSTVKDKKFPTLYLLHGYSDDHTIWMRRTSIERYVAPLGLAVIMPNVHKSFYTDMARGDKYWTFVSEELPAIARGFFPLSEKREDNYVAGLSMGGYGAFKMALRCPEKFSAAASLSGAMDVAKGAINNNPGFLAAFKNIYGDEMKVAGTENDLFYLVKKLEDSGEPKPRLYQCCGTEDFLYQDNIDFNEILTGLTYDYTYEEGPGSHEWAYWDTQIQKVLKWLNL